MTSHEIWDIVKGSKWTLVRYDSAEEAWFDDYLTPICDETGAVVGAHVIAVEITEEKRAEARLRESEEHLRLALQAAQMGSREWDTEQT